MEENSLDLASSAAEGNEKKREALEVTESARKEVQLPSFGLTLFEGDADFSSLYPYPIQSEEDKKVGDRVIDPFIAFLKANLDPEEVDASREIPKCVIDYMKREGIFALKVPKEYGGLGFSQTNYCRLVMQVASYCASTAVLISAHQSIGVPQPLKMFGTDAQKKKFFPRFREGAISAFALTEPGVGSDPAQMACTATPTEDGNHYILNGDKLWCTNGPIADILVVMAKTPSKLIKGKERKQITAFIVERSTPGIELVHRCEFMGLGAIYNGLLRFTNVKVPKENMLGEEGRGLALALSTINVGRLTLPAASAGAAKVCLSIVRRWGGERVQWGMPIGLHEASREKVAYIAATTFAIEAITWLCCAWVDKGGVDIRIEAAMAKLFSTEALWNIADMTMQLRGGRGYEKGRSLKARGEEPYPVERIMRDCRVNTILEGASEIMLLFLAREAIDSHLKRAADLIHPKTSMAQKGKALLRALRFYATWFPKQLAGMVISPSYQEMGEMACYFRYIKKTSHRLAKSIFIAMARYQAGLEKKQRLLSRLMLIGTDLFVMAATCSYALALKEKEPSSLKIARFFCSLAKRRIRDNFQQLANNDDKEANRLAEDVIGSSYQWLEEVQ